MEKAKRQKATIQIKEGAKGEVNVSVEFDPPVEIGREPTQVEIRAAMALKGMNGGKSLDADQFMRR